MGEAETHTGTDAPGAAGFDFPILAREINVNERTGTGTRTRTDPAVRTMTGAGARIRRQGWRCGPPDPVPAFHDAGEKARCW